MRRRIRWTIVMSVIVAVVGCTRHEDPLPVDEITLQLKWLHQSQFAGFYLAQEKGYYADERLKVNFLEGGLNVEVVASLLSGDADFSVVSSELVLVNRQKKKEPIIAIAAIYRRSAVVFAAMEKSGIMAPHDFIGKTVAVLGHTESYSEFETQFNAMMKRQGVDTSLMTLVPYDPNYAAFYAGDVDITAAYYTAGVIHIRNKGHNINLIWPNDYGIHVYSDTLVTTERMVDKKPDVVERFVRASLRGWRDAVGDPDKAVTATLRYAKVKDRNLQSDMMTALIPLVHTGQGKVGWMEEAVWMQMHQVMVDQKILDQPIEDLSKVYTTRFLEGFHGNQEK